MIHRLAALWGLLLLITACAPTAETPPSPSSPPPPSVTPLPPRTDTLPPTTTPVPQTAPPAMQAVAMNVPYVADGSTLQRLDIYLPTSGDGPYPTILAIHGGGFRAQSKLIYRQLARPLTDLGYAVVSADYRLTPQYSYPAQVEDVFCALAWVHENHATYGFDTTRIVGMGDSAGGYLAAMLGTVETPGQYLSGCPQSLPVTEWIQGVVVFYGLYDFTSLEGYSARDIEMNLQPFWGAAYDEIPAETLAEMSPASWIDGSEPPFLIIHGRADTSVPSWMSENFAAALDQAGSEVEMVLLDANHAFILEPLSSPANAASLESIVAFLSSLSEE